MTGTVLDITRQREAEERLRFHATHDPLTGLPNRMLFNQRLAAAMLQSGHAAGPAPAALRGAVPGPGRLQVGQRQPGPRRRRPPAGGDRAAPGGRLLEHVLIARYGGDEFTLLPDGDCGHDRAVEIARSVLAPVRAAVRDRRPAGLFRRQPGHRDRQPRLRIARPGAARRRYGDVPGQGGRQVGLRDLRRGHAPGGPEPAAAGNRFPAGRGALGVPAALPAHHRAFAAAAWLAPRRWCAGATRCAACCRRRSSWPWPRRPA